MTARPLLARLAALICSAVPLAACTEARHPFRVATYNIEDVRTADIHAEDHPRLRAIADVIRELEPDILLIQEIARDPEGTNAQAFADRYLTDLGYRAFMPESNTGIPSGHDLNNDGRVVTVPPPIEPPNPDGTAPRQTAAQRAFGNDAFGFGTFPGQYGMALLVRPGFEVLEDRTRTYRLFKWADLPGATSPTNPDGTPWYTPDEWADLRVSSKTLADIPVRLPDGTVVHCLISHPTPPAFDGPEQRNKHRNRDEIRLLRAVLDNEPWVVDDAGTPGGLPPDALAIVMGDLNADPEHGSSIDDPIGHLLASPRLASDPEPVSDFAIDRLDPWDTAMFRLRVDYVLPGDGLETLRTAVWRPAPDSEFGSPSDHFPVWADVLLRSQRTD